MKKIWRVFIGERAGYDIFTLDMVLISGVCFLNVYAQFFSLFYKIGFVANIILIVSSILLLPVIREELLKLFQLMKSWKYKWGIVIVGMGVMLLLGSLSPDHYDTSLYHAQAIRWIEEYGLVKGLGCLHGRLAFNSAFLTLQALFGYGYITGTELHSCNAFLMFIFHIWALLSLRIWKTKIPGISDAFKGLMLFYIYTCTKDMASPSTDIFAVAMILYVLAKWTELIEAEEYSPEQYMYLCLLTLYGATLKLSAAPFCIIGLYPFCLAVKEKKFRLICKVVFMGSIIVLPFLIRNVLLSGWLLYPVPALDFFQFDWKIPKEFVIKEKLEIETWAKSLTDINLHDMELSEWFPLWFQWIGSLWRKIVKISLLSWGILCIRCIYFKWDKHNPKYKNAMLFVYAVELFVLVLWFVTAPSIRFGGIFCLFAAATMTGEFLNGLYSRIQKQKFLNFAYFGILLIFIMLIEYNIFDDFRGKEFGIITPVAYIEYPVNILEKGGISFYYPVEGDQTGYLCFPSVPGNGIQAELREYGALKSGFRIAER